MRCAAQSARMSLGSDAPDLLRVAAEEVHVETPAETVDHPFLKAFFLAEGAHLPLEVAQHDPRAFIRADVAQRVEQLQRIVEEFLAVVDAAQARER
jgi:hypothetical protein